MKLYKTKRIHLTDYGWVSGISFGIHFYKLKRIDIHFFKWMLSIGEVPIYKIKNKFSAVANTYHNKHGKTIESARSRAHGFVD